MAFDCCGFYRVNGSTFILFRLLRILRYSRPVLRHQIYQVKHVIYADIVADSCSKLWDKIKLLPRVMVILSSRSSYEQGHKDYSGLKIA